MSFAKRFLPPIPAGHQLFDNCEVAGIQHRQENAAAFIKGSNPELELVREPRNKFDPNAVAVYGISKGWLLRKRRHLGYLPKENAAKAVQSGFFEEMTARLRRVYLGDNGFTAIELDVTAPKERMK